MKTKELFIGKQGTEEGVDPLWDYVIGLIEMDKDHKSSHELSKQKDVGDRDEHDELLEFSEEEIMKCRKEEEKRRKKTSEILAMLSLPIDQ